MKSYIFIFLIVISEFSTAQIGEIIWEENFDNLYKDVLLKKYKEGKYVEVIKTIEKTKEKIRKMRSSGLARGGEFSTENLVFKVLRRTDLLGKMNDLITKSTDKILSEKIKM